MIVYNSSVKNKSGDILENNSKGTVENEQGLKYVRMTGRRPEFTTLS